MEETRSLRRRRVRTRCASVRARQPDRGQPENRRRVARERQRGECNAPERDPPPVPLEGEHRAECGDGLERDTGHVHQRQPRAEEHRREEERPAATRNATERRSPEPKQRVERNTHEDVCDERDYAQRVRAVEGRDERRQSGHEPAALIEALAVPHPGRVADPSLREGRPASPSRRGRLRGPANTFRYATACESPRT